MGASARSKPSRLKFVPKFAGDCAGRPSDVLSYLFRRARAGYVRHHRGVRKYELVRRGGERHFVTRARRIRSGAPSLEFQQMAAHNCNVRGHRNPSRGIPLLNPPPIMTAAPRCFTKRKEVVPSGSCSRRV